MGEILDAKPFFNQSPVIVLSACQVGAIAPTLDEVEASGFPGVLISAGAACVLANIWKVEDTTMGYIVERFVTYLSHKGYRPAAALFRAVRDLRLLPKDQALERIRSQIKQMKEDGSDSTDPRSLLKLTNLQSQIMRSDEPFPFNSPKWWGGIIIVGSGWARPAGAIVGPIEDIIEIGFDVMNRRKAISLLSESKPDQAKDILIKLIDSAAGLERAKTLNALAWATWLDRDLSIEQSIKHVVLKMLDEAELLAQAEDAEQLIRNINATRQKVALSEENDVLET